jgi:hypothetical protein
MRCVTLLSNEMLHKAQVKGVATSFEALPLVVDSMVKLNDVAPVVVVVAPSIN